MQATPAWVSEPHQVDPALRLGGLPNLSLRLRLRLRHPAGEQCGDWLMVVPVRGLAPSKPDRASRPKAPLSSLSAQSNCRSIALGFIPQPCCCIRPRRSILSPVRLHVG